MELRISPRRLNVLRLHRRRLEVPPVSKRFLFRSGSGVYTTIAVVVAHARHVHVPGNCLLLRRTLTAMEKGGIEDLGRRW